MPITLIGAGLAAITLFIENKLKKGEIVMTKEKATAKAKAKPTKKAMTMDGLIAEFLSRVLSIVAKPQPNFGTKLAVFGEVCVKNIQLFSEKMAGIIKHIFTSMELGHGVNFINLDAEKTPQGETGPIMAMLFPSTMTITIFLQNHWKECLKLIVEDPENKMSLRALVWYNVILSFFHELCHARTLTEGLASGEIKSSDDFIWTQDHEDAASLYAQNQLRELAKQIDIEIPVDDPLFGAAFNEFDERIKPLEDQNYPWITAHHRMVTKGLVCSTETEDGETVDISSFKEFMRMSCLTAEDREDPAWKTNGTSFIINKEKIPEAVETIILPPPADLGSPVLNQPAQPVTPPPQEASAVYDYNEYMESGIEPDYAQEYGEPVYTPAPVQPVAQTPTLVTPTAQSPTLTTPAAPTLNTPVATPPNTGYVNPVMAAQAAANGQPIQQQTSGNVPATCPPLEMPMEQVMNIVQTVFMRLYYRIFTKCGFNPAEPTSFGAPGGVYDPVHIGDIPGANKVFLSMDVTDEQGKQVRDVPILDSIKGQVFGKSGLPGYWLYLNVNGRKMKRTLVPQNPNKETAQGSGVFTAMAQRVRQNWAIAWVIADAYDGQKSEMMVKIECQPGQKPTFTWKPFQKR
jgi:hypothetical protein